MYLSIILFLINILGFIFNRKIFITNIISTNKSIKITFLFMFNDILGQIYATYIISIAGAESAIGLGILVTFYRLRGSIGIYTNNDSR